VQWFLEQFSNAITACIGAFVGGKTVIPLLLQHRPQITVFEVPCALDKARTSTRCAGGLPTRISSEGAMVSGKFSRRNHCVQWCICGRYTSDTPRRRPQMTIIEVSCALDEVRTSACCAEGLPTRISSEGAVVSGTVFKRNHCVHWCFCGRKNSDDSPRRRPQITVFEELCALDELRTSTRCAEGLPTRMSLLLSHNWPTTMVLWFLEHFPDAITVCIGAFVGERTVMIHLDVDLKSP